MTRTNESRDYQRDDEHAAYGERRAAAQAERFGGMMAGSAFFGWLTAMGMAVLLTAVLAAAGTAVGLGTGTDATEAAQQASKDVGTVGIVGAVAGTKYDVLGRLNSFPRFPVKTSDLTTAGVVALVLAALTSLVGAVVGGSAGMRFHRRVDRVEADTY